ncbi:MAG: hypothetical protein QF441_11450 [Bacteriovoracaceae bacterium]|jgi:hypothetical protein|nr:hypothetical protein [Bacteriovoracaceae bacterium]
MAQLAMSKAKSAQTPSQFREFASTFLNATKLYAQLNPGNFNPTSDIEQTHRHEVAGLGDEELQKRTMDRVANIVKLALSPFGKIPFDQLPDPINDPEKYKEFRKEEEALNHFIREKLSQISSYPLPA